ncbi:MAG: hypothetical protein Q9169_006227 [Polycauliona sp. 2 TL-2023]
MTSQEPASWSHVQEEIICARMSSTSTMSFSITDSKDSRTLVKGFLRSNPVSKIIQSIPCSVVNKLESDPNLAQNFVEQLQAGQTPELINELPGDILNGFQGIFQILAGTPDALVQQFEDVVDTATGLFNDIESGNIWQEIEDFGGEVVDTVKDIGDSVKDIFDGKPDNANQAGGDILDLCQNDDDDGAPSPTVSAGDGSTDDAAGTVQPDPPGVASQIPDGQVQAPASTSIAAPVSQITDGQVQAPTSISTATPVSQMTDGPDVQVPTAIAPSIPSPSAANYSTPDNATTVAFTGTGSSVFVVGREIMMGSALAGLVLLATMVWL